MIQLKIAHLAINNNHSVVQVRTSIKNKEVTVIVKYLIYKYMCDNMSGNSKKKR